MTRRTFGGIEAATREEIGAAARAVIEKLQLESGADNLINATVLTAMGDIKRFPEIFVGLSRDELPFVFHKVAKSAISASTRVSANKVNSPSKESVSEFNPTLRIIHNLFYPGSDDSSFIEFLKDFKLKPYL